VLKISCLFIVSPDYPQSVSLLSVGEALLLLCHLKES
jgi:hypothetical protein